jgi:hypothetical protein
MRATPVVTKYFAFDGRGCSLLRWIHDAELHLPESQAGFSQLSGSIEGAQYLFETDVNADESWIIFGGLQVLKIVPEEVHSYWHREYAGDDTIISGIWVIEGSEWIKTFDQRHLNNHKHYIVEFYDEIVEMVCRDLIFGAGTFDIQRVVALDNRFAYAYLRRAMSQSTVGNKEEAVEYFQKYIDSCPNGESVGFARRSINLIRTGSVDG